ncbi:hypothetical protein [Paenibacillus mucilaginosus]|uniref:hypothetical protein n=1 Tax=Paenibacillus mucilaginosus TaxID=61624 RepID=UPI003D2543B9
MDWKKPVIDKIGLASSSYMEKAAGLGCAVPGYSGGASGCCRTCGIFCEMRRGNVWRIGEKKQ